MTISVKDVNAAAKWYTQKLGFTESRRVKLDGGKIEIAWMIIPGFRIDLAQVRGSVRIKEQKEIPLQGWRHLAFEVDDVDKAYALLKARGVEFGGQPVNYAPPGIRIVYFKDLEGNILELYKDIR